MTTTKAPATFQCPDCDHAPYPTAKGLGTHRNKVHGIPGTSKRAIARAVKKGGHQWLRALAKRRGHNNYPSRIHGHFPCQQCDFVARWKGGLKNHITSKHTPKHKRSQLAKVEAVIPVSQNGHQPHAHIEETSLAASDRALEVALAITLGRFTEICRSMASQHDIPERMFAARFAELVYRTQIRQPHRRDLSVPSM